MWIYPYDVNNVDGIRDLYAHIIAETNGVDVLVKTAGTVGGAQRIWAMQPSFWLQQRLTI